MNEKIAGLAINREVVRAALKPLGDDAVIHSDGAIYMVSTTLVSLSTLAWLQNVENNPGHDSF